VSGLSHTTKRAGQRFLSSLPALLGVLVFTFILMRVLPGDPAVFFASGPNSSQEDIEMIRRQMGLDKPLPTQLAFYLYDIGRGNLGRSLITGQPVFVDLRERLPASLELTFAALILALGMAIPLGVFAAYRAGTFFDRLANITAFGAISLPDFALGLILAYWVGVRQGWLPKTLTPGMKVQVHIHPQRDGNAGGQFLAVTLPDGKVMGNPAGRGPAPAGEGAARPPAE
jgi:peptide/nickel transport system permease protein